jgi:hypothetical protein
MLSSLNSVSLDELLQKTSTINSNVWIALIVDSNDIQATVDDLQDTVEIFTECETGVLSGESGAYELVDQVVGATQDYLLLWQLEMWQAQDWQEFDALRSRLDKGKKGGLLVLSLDSVRSMLANAPNFVSWLGTNIYDFDKDAEILTEEEGEKRLDALREWLGKSDDEVIALAESHMLPRDPEYGEWLILLNRGELLE